MEEAPVPTFRARGFWLQIASNDYRPPHVYAVALHGEVICVLLKEEGHAELDEVRGRVPSSEVLIAVETVNEHFATLEMWERVHGHAD
jgi:hypothetical protein